MARIYYKNAEGDYIRNGDDAYMTGEPEDCCCVECVEGEEPTADFSYEQTDEDPCTIDLTDESTVHANCDGEIIEWKWYKNEETTPFSTSQNPTGVEVEDGDDIRLWVKDSCGCTDEVVMAIECEDYVTCPYCVDSPLPETITVTGSGFSNAGCDDCGPMNATHTLSNNGANCSWDKSVVLDCPSSPLQIVAIIDYGPLGGGPLQLRVDITNGPRLVRYSKTLTPDPATCRGTHIVPYVTQSGSGLAACGWDESSLTVVI